MFIYKDEAGVQVIVVRGKCRCYRKRDHVFHARLQKFCFFWEDVSWYTSLWLIALMTICFGVMMFIFLTLIALRAGPSAISSYLLFPFFSIAVFFLLITFVGLGTMLWIGIKMGNMKLIKAFPWGLLAGYVFAIVFLLLVLVEGELMIRSLVWSQYGMLIKSDPKKENKCLVRERFIYYSLMAFIILLITFFTTYIIILSLSSIDKLEYEIES